MILYPVEARSDCVVALQEGEVDAITSDDTILKSFQSQDQVRHTKLIDLPGDVGESEPYAIAITKGKSDLVRFVNGVLDQMRADGSLHQLYVDWLKGDAPATVPLPSYR